MPDSDRNTARPRHRTSIALILAATCCLGLAACSSHDDSAQTASAKIAPPVDACTLLSDGDVHALASDLGSGHESKVKIANVSTCQWDDAKHLPALTLQVAPADPSGVKKGLQEGFSNMGYAVSSVAGLGDDAAVAVQRADPAHGIEAGVALLVVQVGKRQLVLSPIRLPISSTNSAGFERLKSLASKAVAHLRALN